MTMSEGRAVAGARPQMHQIGIADVGGGLAQRTGEVVEGWVAERGEGAAGVGEVVARSAGGPAQGITAVHAWTFTGWTHEGCRFFSRIATTPGGAARLVG
ncbi:hypothetical protein [Streptomyces sp. GbtcB6]|uniref:hypothetical protein n=1 Tax=Streptomyces sp. GbtcB6 TaxID=2824751 RepID=UPI001C306132|nr:hypothetical protein [Streptomyces sp. GbtcB6]